MNRRHLARLKERLQPRVEELDLWGTDLDSFRRCLERLRQRPVYLMSRPLSEGVLALWIAEDTYDWIVYEENTTPYHQRHLVLHEGSHMLLGHKGRPLNEVAPLMAPHLDLRLVRHLLCHSDIDTDEEAEAEVFATLIEERMDQASPPAIPNVSPKATRAIAEFFLQRNQ